MVQYQSTDVPKKDYDKVVKLLSGAKPYEAVLMQDAISQQGSDDLEGWWYGCYQSGELESVAYIRDSVVYLYGLSSASMVNLGSSMARSYATRSTSTQHQVFGSDDLVAAFWQGFQVANRTLVGDSRMPLMRLQLFGGKLRDSFLVRVAGLSDLKLVEAFLAEVVIDEVGMDPRKVSKERHESHCRLLISSGEFYLGYYRGKPAFCCRRRSHGEHVYLEHVYFSVPMRRPKVMSGIMSQLSALLCVEGVELLVYGDMERPEFIEALKEIGYESVCVFRLLKLR